MVREVQKQNVNVAHLRAAEELTPGVLPSVANQVWIQMRPRQISPFGASFQTVEDDTITPDGIPEAQATTDQSAAAELGYNWTFWTLAPFLESMFQSRPILAPEAGGPLLPTQPIVVTITGYDIGTPAAAAGFVVNHLVRAEDFATPANNGRKLVTGVTGDEVEVAGLVAEATPPIGAFLKVVGYQFPVGDLTVVHNVGELPRIESATIDMTTIGVVRGMLVHLGDPSNSLFRFDAAENFGWCRVFQVTSVAIIFDKTSGGSDGETEMGAVAGGAKTVRIFFGDMSRRFPETDTNFRVRSHTWERGLGRPLPLSQPAQLQGQIIEGGFINTTTLTHATSDKLTTAFEILGLRGTPKTGATGDELPSTLVTPDRRILVPAASIFNASNDVPVIRLQRYLGVQEFAAPQRLIERLTDISTTLSNNMEVTRAIGSKGGFDVTTGVLSGVLQMTGYYVDPIAEQAIEQEQDVTMHIIHRKAYRGRFVATAVDVAVGRLGDGRTEGERNQAFRIPLTLTSHKHEDFGFNITYQQFFDVP